MSDDSKVLKKTILIINTGGTLSCTEKSDGLSPELSKETLLEKLSPVSNGADLKFLDLFSLDSANISPKHWKKIADVIGENYKFYGGFVIIHGTDTLAYTSSMLSHMLKGIPIPVVITGSQLPIANPVADALENMRAAIYMVTSNNPGVFVAFDRKIMLASCVSKTHSMSFDAFESINKDNVAIINAYGMKINKALLPKVDPFFKVRSNYSEEVFLLKLTPGLKCEIIDKLIEMGYKGLVIESFGLGGLPFKDENFNEKVKNAVEKGLKVIILSQCTYDGINLDVYETGIKTKETGIIYMPEVTKEFAYTKLMWELGNN